MKETIVKISVNGRKLPETILDAEIPSTVLYIEADEYAELQAAGLSAEENSIESLCRSAEAFLDAAFQTVKQLQGISPEAAARVLDYFSFFYPEDQAEE